MNTINSRSVDVLEEHENQEHQQIQEPIVISPAPPPPKRFNLSQASLAQVQENQDLPPITNMARAQSDNRTISGGSSSVANQKGLVGLMMMKRKVNKWKKTGGAAGSTMGSSIRSGPKLQMENSYRLEPADMVDQQKVKAVMNESIKLFMAKQSSYSPAKSAQVSRYLTEDIKTRLKQFNIKRYKFVVHVMIGQSKEQGMQYVTRCIWDTQTDDVATVVYAHKDLFVVANVFAIYFD